MKGKNLPVIDGVNTAGTAMRETTSLVEGNEGGKVVELVIALDCALFSCFRAALRRCPRKPVPWDRMDIPLGLALAHWYPRTR
jgi:orotate phosphoribosyltransferase